MSTGCMPGQTYNTKPDAAAPCSEPEVQMLNRVAQEFQPHVWINMHSGMEALFMPYDHVAALPDDSAGRVSLSLLLALDSVKCGGRCATGSGGKSVGECLTSNPMTRPTSPVV